MHAVASWVFLELKWLRFENQLFHEPKASPLCGAHYANMGVLLNVQQYLTSIQIQKLPLFLFIIGHPQAKQLQRNL